MESYVRYYSPFGLGQPESFEEIKIPNLFYTHIISFDKGTFFQINLKSLDDSQRCFIDACLQNGILTTNNVSGEIEHDCEKFVRL